MLSLDLYELDAAFGITSVRRYIAEAGIRGRLGAEAVPRGKQNSIPEAWN